MTDTTTNFNPIPRLQQIAATIEESGADIFDAPATAVHYIECAIKEIERLRKERDEARREAMSWIIDQACSHEEIEEEYKKRGWSYLKKENTNG